MGVDDTTGYQGPHALNTVYYVCEYQKEFEYVGALIRLATDCQRNKERSIADFARAFDIVGQKDMYNPPIHFTELSPPTNDAQNHTIGFMDLAPNDISWAAVDDPSHFPAKVPDGAVFLAAAGEASCPAGSINAVPRDFGDSPDAWNNPARHACAEAVAIAVQAEGLRLDSLSAYGMSNDKSYPTGCSLETNGKLSSNQKSASSTKARFNRHPSGNGHPGRMPVCVRTTDATTPWASVDLPPSKYVLQTSTRLLHALHVPCPITHKQVW